MEVEHRSQAAQELSLCEGALLVAVTLHKSPWAVQSSILLLPLRSFGSLATVSRKLGGSTSAHQPQVSGGASRPPTRKRAAGGRAGFCG